MKITLLLCGAFGALLVFNPSASAQDATEMSATPAQQAQMLPGVRYTTGCVTTAGWEKTLTDANPNLRRWNWSAMTTYTQSCYNKVPAGAFVKKASKPQEAMKPVGSVYSKPIHVNPDTFAKPRAPQNTIVVGTGTGTGNVSGRIHVPKSQIASAAPAAKSYNINYGVSGTLVPEGESLASRNVHGRLIRTQ